ncbi:MAG TPA: LON peptidase substrate-binding domain-containing protein, partial [Acidobacteriota bacterium]|nr:LON peptidase substrate-binding domain-containing protein [Acidobacteriota bacterium]
MNVSGSILKETKSSAQIPAGALAILPLRNSVLFPNTLMPLSVGRPSSLLAVEEAVRQQFPIGVVLQRDPSVDAPQLKDLYEVGTTGD